MRHAVRTAEMQERFDKEKEQRKSINGECPLCVNPSVKEFTYWRLIENDYPYDVIATTHHMLVPKRHVGQLDQMTPEEVSEYREIEKSIEGYDAILRNYFRAQSIPEHYHVHLFVYKLIE